eukprot:761230-Hanusia_phi.AAC.4
MISNDRFNEHAELTPSQAEHYRGKAVLVDCLTLWLTNFFMEEGVFSMPKGDEETVTVSSDMKPAETVSRVFAHCDRDLLQALQKAKQEFDKLVSQWDVTFVSAVFVTNEIGSGVHPEHSLSRVFVDCQFCKGLAQSACLGSCRQSGPHGRGSTAHDQGYFLVSVDRNIQRISAECVPTLVDGRP